MVIPTQAKITCIHPYRKPLAPDASVCLKCGAVVTTRTQSKEEAPVRMPPEVYKLTENLWFDITPWHRITYSIAKKFGWYVTVLNGLRHIVMPIFDDMGEPVFYSARLIDKAERAPKYRTHPGRRKPLWKSGKLGKIVLVAEGIADAAYLSQLASSVGLLGSYGNLQELVADNRTIVIIMDGDVPGVEASFKILQKLKKAGHVKANVAQLGKNLDPTDVPLWELQKLIKKQTGVKI